MSRLLTHEFGKKVNFHLWDRSCDSAIPAGVSFGFQLQISIVRCWTCTVSAVYLWCFWNSLSAD